MLPKIPSTVRAPVTHRQTGQGVHFSGHPPPSAKLASLPHVPELVCFWLVSWRAGRADKLAILWESGWTQGDVVASESTSHAATTCPSRVAVLVVANPNKAFLDGPFGLPFLQCPWAFSVTASRMRMSQNHAWEAHRILPDSAISSRPVQKTITVTQISVTHNIRPPTPQANRRQASPKLIPPRRDKQPSLQTSRSPRGIKEPEPTSARVPQKRAWTQQTTPCHLKTSYQPSPAGPLSLFPVRDLTDRPRCQVLCAQVEAGLASHPPRSCHRDLVAQCRQRAAVRRSGCLWPCFLAASPVASSDFFFVFFLGGGCWPLG